MNGSSRLILSLLGLSAAACTNVDLFSIDGRDTPPMGLRGELEICAPPPLVESAPYKVLFVVDTSGSTAESDPSPPGGRSRREEAVRLAISENIQDPNVSFGLITFSSQPRRQTYGFTRDVAILNAAAANIGTAQGGTNYSDTVWTMIDFISYDLAALEPGEAARTHYLVYWLSDGEPTVGVLEEKAIVPGVTYLEKTLENRAGGFRLNTVFLGGATTDPSRTRIAQRLLQGMAAEGRGSFVNVERGERLSIEVVPQTILRRFILASVVADNLCVVLENGRSLADSDADGLSDGLEAQLGTDPLDPDGDRDGIRDGIEVMAGSLDPKTFDATCDGATDTDQDGLFDCEERLLGTLVGDPDSDGDLLPDGVELFQNGAPLVSDGGTDTDVDGFPDATETRAHLDPRHQSSAEDLAWWGYRYNLSELPSEGEDIPRCYRVDVENVHLEETLPADAHPAGENIIEIYAAFRPEDGGNPSRFARTRLRWTFLYPDVYDPPTLRFTRGPDDFEHLP